MKSSIVTIAFLFRIVVVETLTVFLYVYKENDKKNSSISSVDMFVYRIRKGDGTSSVICTNFLDTAACATPLLPPFPS